MQCHYCDAPATTRDHVIPKMLGGPDSAWNLVPACAPCNGRKGHETYEDFTGFPVLPLRCRMRGFETTAVFVLKYGNITKLTELRRAERRRRRGRQLALQ